MMDGLTHIEKLVMMHETGDWDITCKWAEEHIPGVQSHMKIWGPHCGAPRSVYLGHLVRLLVDIGSPPKRGES